MLLPFMDITMDPYRYYKRNKVNTVNQKTQYCTQNVVRKKL